MPLSLLWVFWVFSLVITSTSGNVRVTVVPPNPALAVTGPVVLTTEDTSLLVPADEPLTVQTVSGDLVLDAQTDSAAPIRLNTVSGDLRVLHAPACSLRVHTVSGDIRFEGDPARRGSGFYRVSTVSGSVKGAVPPVPGRYRVASGTLDLRFPYEPDTLVTETLVVHFGRLRVSVQGTPLEPDTPGVYRHGRYRLVVRPSLVRGRRGQELWPPSMPGWGEGWLQPPQAEGEEEPEEEEADEAGRPLPRRVLALMPVHPGASSGWVDYNRVNGFTLRFPVVSHQSDWGLGNLAFGSRARFEVAAAFGRRIPGEPNRWKRRFGYWAEAEVGGRPQGLPGAFLWSQAWLHRTASLNRWTLRPCENFLGSVLFKMDAYDYYLSSGVAGGLGLRWRRHLWLRAGLRNETVDSLPVTQKFSVFHSEAAFRSNPATPHYDLQGAELAAEVRWRGLSLAAWGFRSLDSTDRYLWQALFRWHQPLAFGDLRFRAATGASAFSPPSPLAVYLGGLGTLPGYDFHADSGSRFLLVNGEVSLESPGPNLLIFGDAGRIAGHDWLADAGLGLGLGPLALRLVVPLDRPRAYRILFRFQEWF